MPTGAAIASEAVARMRIASVQSDFIASRWDGLGDLLSVQELEGFPWWINRKMQLNVSG